MGPSAIQILIVVGVVVLLFGAGRIAGFGKGLGEGIRNFRNALQDVEKDAELPSPGGAERD